MSALAIQVKDLRQELTVAKELHGEQVSAFEKQIAELTEAKEGYETKVSELDKALTEANENAEAFRIEAEKIKAGIVAKDESIKALEKELDKAKAALADPSLSPVADAGADAGDEGTPNGEAPVSLETLQSLSGEDRVAYFAKHKAELYNL